MSNNVGKKPVEIKEGVQVKVVDGLLKVTGPKGELTTKIPEVVSVEVTDKEAVIKRKNELRETDKFLGLTRALLHNMVKGVNEGFSKNLELTGVGYRAKIEGTDLVLNVGFANAVKIIPPTGITFAINEGTISVSGADKSLVGDVADKIRKVRVPDPYKAKGIKYSGEHIRRKVGKAAKAVGAVK
jgi:large subunit ribosomal protein L6